jgi:soluble P-type ATPase
MVSVDIPPATRLELSHLVCDFNGTLAVDGRLLPGVSERLVALADSFTIHVLTSDTYGGARERLAGLPVTVAVLPADRQTERKADYVNELGADNVVSIGNGGNDSAMIEAAALGMCVVQDEGASVSSVMVADIVCMAVTDALDMLIQPKRLVATLRV